MWAHYMNEVRSNAFSDAYEPSQVNELIDGMNNYRGVVTHPVETYTKDSNHIHQSLPRTIPKHLTWVNRTMAKWH